MWCTLFSTRLFMLTQQHPKVDSSSNRGYGA